MYEPRVLTIAATDDNTDVQYLALPVTTDRHQILLHYGSGASGALGIDAAAPAAGVEAAAVTTWSPAVTSPTASGVHILTVMGRFLRFVPPNATFGGVVTITCLPLPATSA